MEERKDDAGIRKACQRPGLRANLNEHSLVLELQHASRDLVVQDWLRISRQKKLEMQPGGRRRHLEMTALTRISMSESGQCMRENDRKRASVKGRKLLLMHKDRRAGKVTCESKTRHSAGLKWVPRKEASCVQSAVRNDKVLKSEPEEWLYGSVMSKNDGAARARRSHSRTRRFKLGRRPAQKFTFKSAPNLGMPLQYSSISDICDPIASSRPFHWAELDRQEGSEQRSRL
ncbi:hypothetical protein C8F04DRAFT_1185524 [Mycena alexandri]|uniref:Uncharacterized protein n=1 Tax=Mycena alexandri TaxID=1745969 RepID=A0AAD6SPS8_9AGAR|nr:hypothetical protein C8F04DRAFT_1185524 [Mycena alexandri]